MSSPATILAIETSVGPCSVCIMKGDTVLAEETILDFHQQSKMLVPMCESVLKKAGLSYADLDGIASTAGPGSFTSIRVGLAAAKALAFGAGKPFYGVTTLAAMAFAAKGGNEPLFVAIDAHRGEVYTQVFGPDGTSGLRKMVAVPVALLGESFKALPYQLLGNRQEELKVHFPDATHTDIVTPTAVMVGKLVLAKLRQNHTDFLSSPVYIRPPDAKLPGNRLPDGANT